MATISGTSGGDTLNGTPDADTIDGREGRDTIDGKEGDDTLIGGEGNDTLLGGQGNDHLIGDNLPGGPFAGGIDQLFGGDGDDILDAGRFGYAAGFSSPQENLYGEAGNDTMLGVGGQAMYGGTGDDTFYVNTSRGSIGDFNNIIPEDRVFEVAGEGFDTAYVSISSYVLPEGQSVERLIVDTNRPSSTSSVSITGNGFDQELIGDATANSLSGMGGNDVLRGNEGDDYLTGGDGDDVIVGGLGADLMEGGAGSDTFYVDNAGDEIVDPVAEGTDRVATSVSYAIDSAADIEIIEAINLSSTTALTFIGNQFGQVIIGNAGDNELHGEGGNDTLLGLGGDDFLFGGPGNDVMEGGSGNDTYYVDAAGDLVIEEANGGIDRIASTASVFLADLSQVELLEAVDLTSTNPLDFTGSLIANTIIGNNGPNLIRGGGGNDELIGAGGNDVLVGDAGADVLRGGTGDDTYYVEDAGDLVFEDAGAGIDRVATSASIALPSGSHVEFVEAVNLHSTNALDLIGSDTANRLVGNDGVNFIDGRGGSDSLFGGGGADVFQFSSSIGNDIDRIIDFHAGTDRVSLDDAVFSALSAGELSSDFFRVGSAAQDADDHVIYNPATGALSYDVDGAGGAAATQFATLDVGLQLSASDFFVV